MTCAKSIEVPFGKSDEDVTYSITTTSDKFLAAVLDTFADEASLEDVVDGTTFINLEGTAQDVVRLVQIAEATCDTTAEVTYTLLDTPEQDWEVTLGFGNYLLTSSQSNAVVV
tara:strand:+ start:1974 stop:2312 length:339 start_codon:yes stop_codon:yes gene_type:complete